jgi:predicted nucleotidyltransferase component of viral defense system
MIPITEIRAWSNVVPWVNDEQIEQDLVICRSVVEIYSDKFLSENLVFRGGTALHKLYLNPQPRYSEDIDNGITKRTDFIIVDACGVSSKLKKIEDLNNSGSHFKMIYEQVFIELI